MPCQVARPPLLLTTPRPSPQRRAAGMFGTPRLEGHRLHELERLLIGDDIELLRGRGPHNRGDEVELVHVVLAREQRLPAHLPQQQERVRALGLGQERIVAGYGPTQRG